MARYLETIATTLAQDAAFAYLANLEHFADWDPGVRSSVLVRGDGPALGSAYDVTVNGVGRPMTLRYEIVAYEPPGRLVIDARTRTLRSVDTITVQAQGVGALVTYEATLWFDGLMRVANPVLAPFFHRIARRGGEGLRQALARMERS